MKHFLALLILTPMPIFGAFVLIEDFDNLTQGPLSGQNGWTAGTLWSVAAAPLGGNGNAGAGAFSTSATQAAYRFLDTPIDNTSTAATLFFRFRREGAVASSSGLFGDPTRALFDAFATQIDGSQFFTIRDHTDMDLVFRGDIRFADATWYNMWMVVDNATNNYEVWIDSGDFGSPAAALTRVADPNGREYYFGFRNGAAANPLNGILLAIGTDVNSNGTFYVDDFYVDLAGQNLNNPVPEPSTAALLALTGALAMLRGRGSRQRLK